MAHTAGDVLNSDWRNRVGDFWHNPYYNLPPNPPRTSPCPSCGYCPTCGRRRGWGRDHWYTICGDSADSGNICADTGEQNVVSQAAIDLATDHSDCVCQH